MKKFASVKMAKEIIEESKKKENTSYFGQHFTDLLPEYLTFEDMKQGFIDKGFGEAETNLILACMIKCGCKFTI